MSSCQLSSAIPCKVEPITGPWNLTIAWVVTFGLFKKQNDLPASSWGSSLHGRATRVFQQKICWDYLIHLASQTECKVLWIKRVQYQFASFWNEKLPAPYQIKIRSMIFSHSHPKFFFISDKFRYWCAVKINQINGIHNPFTKTRNGRLFLADQN